MITRLLMTAIILLSVIQCVLIGNIVNALQSLTIIMLAIHVLIDTDLLEMERGKNAGNKI